MRKSLSILFYLMISTTIFPVDSLKTDRNDWWQWRGANRDGISHETNLLEKWPEDGPKELWRITLGEGYSSITIKGGYVYTMFDEGENEFAICLNEIDGQEIWRFRTDHKYRDSWGNGPRMTPLIDGDYLYVISAHAKLYKLNRLSGEVLWQVNIPIIYGGEAPDLGYSNTPILFRNLLLLTGCGGKNSSILALERENGQLVWASQTDHPGYSSPIIIQINKQPQAIFFTGTKITGLSPIDGRIYWEHPWRTDAYENVATPVILPGNRVFFSCPHPETKGAGVLQISPQGDGYTAAPVWMNNDMKNHFSTTVYYDGYLYGTDRSILTCIDAETGAVQWRQRGFGEGNLILANDKFIVLGTRGKLALVAATSGTYQEISSAKVLNGKCFTMPSLSNGKLFLRNEKEIVCLSIRN